MTFLFLASNVKIEETFGDYQTMSQVQAVQQQLPQRSMAQYQTCKSDVSLQDLVYDQVNLHQTQACAGPRSSFNGGVCMQFNLSHGSPISTRSSVDEGVDGLMDPISDGMPLRFFLAPLHDLTSVSTKR